MTISGSSGCAKRGAAICRRIVRRVGAGRTADDTSGWWTRGLLRALCACAVSARSARRTSSSPARGLRRFGQRRSANRTGHPVAAVTCSARDAGMQARDRQLARVRIRLHDAQIGDHFRRTLGRHAQPRASIAARHRGRATSGSRAVRRTPRASLRHHDEDPLAAGRHFGCAAAAGQPHLGLRDSRRPPSC